MELIKKNEVAINKTYDYDMFKLLDYNRPTKESHIKALMDSMSKDYIIDPIKVNKFMGVIDGQHRLEACRRLKLPVYYMVYNKVRTKAIISLNKNNRNWQDADYLNYYIKLENLNYIRLKAFMEENNLSIFEVLALSDSFGSNKQVRDIFRDGEYIFNKKSLIDIVGKYNIIRRLAPLQVRPALILTGFLYKHPKFLENPDYWKRLSRKLQMYPNMIKGLSTKEDILKGAEELFNHNEKKLFRVRLYEPEL